MSAPTTATPPAIEGPRTSWRDALRGVRLIAAREVATSFDTGIATVTAIAFALLANSIFMNEFFLTGTVDMTGFFELQPLLLAFFLPAISMRLWAEERRQRTAELLLTLPIQPGQAVLGKYLAGLFVFGLFLASSLPIPVMLEVLGSPDRGLILSGYLGLLFLGGLFLAFGCLLSALSRDQIVAFVGSTLIGFVLVLTGNETVVAVLDGLLPDLAPGTFLQDTISVLPPYLTFVRGVIELSAVLYFVLFASVFLWCTTLVVRHARS